MRAEPSLGRTSKSFFSPAAPEKMSPDARLRFQHFTVFLLLGLPTAVVFGVVNLLRGNHFLSAIIGVAAGGLICGWIWFSRTGRWKLVYRTNTVAFSWLVLYMVAMGGVEGSMSLWAFTLPLVTLFGLGRGEGFAWAMVLFGGISGLMLTSGIMDGVYPYPADFKIRFLTIFFLVSILAYWFEHSRQSFRAGMEDKHRKLEREIEERKEVEKERENLIKQLQGALDEVHALSGLLPICSHCHRIRDDSGYWTRLEKFIGDRSDARFSHGICPTCLEEHFPEERLIEDVAEGKPGRS